MVDGSPQRILEIGCATGVMGQAIKKLHPHCFYVGLEIDKESAEQAKKVLDQVIVGDIQKMSLSDYGIARSSFDYVLFGDVLEHLYDPWTVLYYCKQYLKNTGCIVASIPNVRNLEIVNSLINGYFTYKDEGILDSTHLRFFTYKEILSMFDSCDLEIMQIKNNIAHYFDFNKIDMVSSIDLPKFTIKSLSQEEIIELSTIQFIVKAKNKQLTGNELFYETQKPFEATSNTVFNLWWIRQS